MSRKNINLKLFGFVAVVIFCVTLLMISVSFAETEDPAPAVPEEQTESQEAVDPQEQTPEVEGEGEAEAEEPSAEQDASTINETNAPQLQIFLPNGTTPAKETVDYDYSNNVISVKTDSLIIVGNPSVSVTDVIEVNKQPSVHNLTLRNVNMNNTRNIDGINIIECSQNASFNLNIEGTCTYTASGGQWSFIKYYVYNFTPTPTFNNLYIKGSENSHLTAYLDGDAILYYCYFDTHQISSATHFCGGLNINVPNSQSEWGCFQLNKGYGDIICDLYFEDNVSVYVSNTLSSFESLDYAVIEADGNIYVKDNACLDLYSKKESALSAHFYQYDKDNYLKLYVLDNASAYFRSSSDTFLAVRFYNIDISVNTTGVFSCVNDNNVLGLELKRDDSSDPPCKFEVKKGTVYLSGLSSGDWKIGSMSSEGYNLDMPEEASFRGAPNTNAGDQDLIYDAFLGEVDPIGSPNLYSMYINTNTNARVPAGTVKISYPPAPDPAPEEYYSAQTGDNLGSAVALCVVTIVASTGYIFSRKLRKI